MSNKVKHLSKEYLEMCERAVFAADPNLEDQCIKSIYKVMKTLTKHVAKLQKENSLLIKDLQKK